MFVQISMAIKYFKFYFPITQLFINVLQIEGFFLRKPYRRLFIRFRKIKFINWFFHICILRSNDVKK